MVLLNIVAPFSLSGINMNNSTEIQVQDTKQLPALLDESNINNADIETQIRFYREQIASGKKFTDEFESVLTHTQETASKYPIIRDIVMDCNKIQIEIDLILEELREIPEHVQDKSILEDKVADTPVENSSAMRKRKSALKKRIAKLLHPDVTRENFDSELYAHAMALLDSNSLDELERLLDKLTVAKNKKASKFSKAQAREELKSILTNLKLEFFHIQQTLTARLQSSEGLIYKLSTQYGADSQAVLNAIYNIQKDNFNHLREVLADYRYQLELSKELKRRSDIYSGDDSDFTVDVSETIDRNSKRKDYDNLQDLFNRSKF